MESYWMVEANREQIEEDAPPYGVRVWFSNTGRRYLTDKEWEWLQNQLAGDVPGVFRNVVDNAIVEGPERKVDRMVKGIGYVDERYNEITGDVEAIFDLLEISWWERQTTVVKAGIVLTPIAVGAAITKALEWW